MKHNIKKRIAAILCSLAVAVPMATNVARTSSSTLTANATVYTDYSNPNGVRHYCSPIPMYTQYGNHSCWAFVLRALTVYKYSYFPSDNELASLAQTYTTNTGQISLQYYPDSVSPVDASISSGAYTYVVQNYFSGAFQLPHPSQHLSGATISAYINADKPIIMFCQSAIDGHILLLYGYYTSGVNGNVIAVDAYDPFSGTSKYISIPNSGNATFIGDNGYVYTWNKSMFLSQ